MESFAQRFEGGKKIKTLRMKRTINVRKENNDGRMVKRIDDNGKMDRKTDVSRRPRIWNVCKVNLAERERRGQLDFEF